MRAKVAGFLLSVALSTSWSCVYAADPPPPQYAGAYPVELRVGDIFVVATSVAIVTPVRFPICDDLRVVNVVDTPNGLAFKGIAPGKTRCSVASGATMGGAIGSRRVFEITVRD